MKKRRIELWPIASASIAFLLNWLMVVDRDAIATLAQPLSQTFLDLNQSSFVTEQAPVHDITVLAFQTVKHQVRVFQRGDHYYMDVINPQTSEGIIEGPVTVAISAEGTRYTYAGKQTFTAFEASNGHRKLMIQNGMGQQEEQEY